MFPSKHARKSGEQPILFLYFEKKKKKVHFSSTKKIITQTKSLVQETRTLSNFVVL